MTEERIPRKWEFIASELEKIDAPKKVVNAAVEIDNVLIELGLGYNTEEWEMDFDYISTCDCTNLNTLKTLVINQIYCTACDDCNEICKRCKLGRPFYCTPRSKHADKYFPIVRKWVSKKAKQNI